MKSQNPKIWWNEIKHLGGTKDQSGNLLSRLDMEELESLSCLTKQELANAIGKAFLDPLEEWRTIVYPIQSVSFPWRSAQFLHK
jgi:hypothetical protein